MERFNHRDDSAGLNTATGFGTEDGNWTQQTDTLFRLRVQFNDTAASTKTSNYTFGLEFQINGGGFSAVGASSALQAANSAQFADDDATTSAQLTAGNGSFVNGVGDENGAAPSAGNVTLGNGAGHTEMEFCLLIDSGQVSDGDSIEVRATGTDAAAAVTATITVDEPLAVPPPRRTLVIAQAVTRLGHY